MYSDKIQNLDLLVRKITAAVSSVTPDLLFLQRAWAKVDYQLDGLRMVLKYRNILKYETFITFSIKLNQQFGLISDGYLHNFVYNV